jgi:hypothetical protein
VKQLNTLLASALKNSKTPAAKKSSATPAPVNPGFTTPPGRTVPKTPGKNLGKTPDPKSSSGGSMSPADLQKMVENMATQLKAHQAQSRTAVENLTLQVGLLTSTLTTPGLPGGTTPPPTTNSTDLVKSTDRIATTAYDAMVDGYGCPTKWAKDYEFSNKRTANEVRRWAVAVKTAYRQYGRAFLQTDLGEVMLRNMVGLQKADEFGKPTLMNEFEWFPEVEVVPREFVRILVKDSARVDNFKKKNGKASKATTPASGSASTGRPGGRP